MAFATRSGGSWEEGFLHAAASTLSPVLERPAPAAADGDAAAPAGGESGMDPLSGMLSPKRMRAEQRAGSAYAPDLARALKAVVKVRGSAVRADARPGGRGALAQTTRRAPAGAPPPAPTNHAPTDRPPRPAQIFTASALPNFSQPWQMQAQSKCTASGFAIAPLSSRRILTNAHAVANQVGNRAARAAQACGGGRVAAAGAWRPAGAARTAPAFKRAAPRPSPCPPPRSWSRCGSTAMHRSSTRASSPPATRCAPGRFKAARRLPAALPHGGGCHACTSPMSQRPQTSPPCLHLPPPTPRSSATWPC
jgi:hypothetical protein